MDFDHAISAHSNWKGKLRAYLAKPDRSLSPSEIAQDNKCDLGKWIHGEGAVHANLPEFQTLRSEHAHFHKAAAEVVRKADAGHDMTEETALGSKSEFATASSNVVNAILGIKSKVAKEKLVTR